MISLLFGNYGRIMITALVCAVAPMTTNASQSVELGKAAAAVCVACHQVDGNGLEVAGATSWPRLAGLDAKYLAKQIRDFKSGARQSAEMSPFANMLSDAQIDDVAEYYSSLVAKAPNITTPVAQEVLDAGQKLALHGDWDRYIVSCVSCHGPGNQGVGSTFPDISGQHAGYIANQLLAWRDGTRQGDPLGLMQAIAERMNDEDITAVSAWLSTQPPASEQIDNVSASMNNGAKK